MNAERNVKNTISRSINHINLTQLRVGKYATIYDILGEKDIVNKVEAMGIAPGMKVKKVSASLFHGPILLQKDFMQIAVGYDIAKNILVDALN